MRDWALYLEHHSLVSLRNIGWRWKTLQWGNMVLLDPLVLYLNRTEGGWTTRNMTCMYNCGREDTEVMDKWCSIKKECERIVDRMMRQKEHGALENEAFFNLIQTHLYKVKRDMRDAGMHCSD